MTQKNASLLMVVAAVMWGTNPALIQLAAWTEFGTALFRALCCALLLLIYILAYRKFSLSSLSLQIPCALFLAINSFLFVSASLKTSPANAVLLMFIFPWITMGLDCIFRQFRPNRFDIIRLLLGVLGIATIVSGDLSGDINLGDGFAVLAGIAIALHIFFSQSLQLKHQRNNEVLSAIFLAWIISIIVLGGIISVTPSTLPSSDAIGYLLAFGILSALPWFLWSKAVAFISGHVVAALLGVEVFIAALCGWAFLGDAPALTTWFGGALVLTAASWQIVTKR